MKKTTQVDGKMVRVETDKEDYIETALKQYSVTDAAITILEKELMPLKIDGIDDVAGYKKVRAGRMKVKGYRVETEKTRKGLKEESIIFGRGVDAKAKSIASRLLPIEEYLYKMEQKIDEEKQRIKDEADRKERERIQGRLQKLYGMGCVFDGFGYVYKSKQEDVKIEISTEQIQAMTDDEYETLIAQVADMKEQDSAAQAELDRQKKEEEDRLAKIREEQEAESKRFAAEREKIRQEQEEKERKLKEAQDKLDAEKQAMETAKEKIEEDKRKDYLEKLRLEEIENAKKEALELAEKKAKEKTKKEAEEKAEKERIAKMEAELAEKLRPDNEKLLALADVIYKLKMPELTNKQSYDILNAAFGHLQRARQILRQGAE